MAARIDLSARFVTSMGDVAASAVREMITAMAQHEQDGKAPKPIAFVAAMVRAVIDGRKTQTRRLVRPAPDLLGRDHNGNAVAFRDGKKIVCPFGSIGNQLWVRERWAQTSSGFVYAADSASTEKNSWRQSQFMPRAASRISLRVREVRLEHLRQISRDDAIAEGFDSSSDADPLQWFEKLWNSLAGENTRWDDDPWVWVIGFEVIARPRNRRRVAS